MRKRLLIASMVLMIAAASVLAADVRLYGFTKGRLYNQISPAKPTIETGFEFHAFVELTRPSAASTVTLQWPGQGKTRSLTNYTTSWRIREVFTSGTGLNTAAPNGAYTYTIETGADGKKTIQLNLSADFYPEIPYLVNYAAAQEIDHTKIFTLSLGPTAAGAGDFIHVQILEGNALVWETPATPDLPGALTGTATSINIPANTLAQGRTYTATLSIWKMSTKNTTAYPGALGVTAYVRQTETTIRTAFTTTDTHWFGLMKQQRFVQSSALGPAPAILQPFGYLAFAEATDALNISGVSVRLPNNASKTLTRTDAAWRFGESFLSPVLLNQACPIGTATVTLNTAHNGMRQVDLEIVQGNFPAAPYISNWDEANRIDAAEPFVLSWAPLAGGTTADFVQVRVEKNGQLLFKTGDHPKAPGALHGQSTSVTLPPGLLSAGDECQAVILYFKPLFTEPYVYPKTLGLTGVASETTGTLRTRGGNFPRPKVEGVALQNGQLRVAISGTKGRQYILQSTKDYSNWLTVLTTNAPENLFDVGIPHTTGDTHQIFRVLSW